MTIMFASLKSHTLLDFSNCVFTSTDICGQPQTFRLADTSLRATEGSCVEMKCSVSYGGVTANAYFFWIMNSTWNDKVLSGTVIYSTNVRVRPVSQGFADRVTYTGSSSSTWNSYDPPESCSISICNLKKSDSGDYLFRYLDEKTPYKYMTDKLTLTVTANPCPITFDKPAVVVENAPVTLKCSTLSSCSSNLQIGGLEQLDPSPTSGPQPPYTRNRKTTTVSFTANWQDDGKEFSCQTQDNTDTHLIRKIKTTVEYPPKDTSAKKSNENDVEGQTVTLTCAAKGNPAPTFTWFKNKNAKLGQGAEWTIRSITESENGEYHCEATNKYNTEKSNPVFINVKYKPEVRLTPSASEVTQGDKVTLTCEVKRANPNPAPYSFTWLLNGTTIVQGWTNRYVIERIEPEQRGRYKCQTTNDAGTGTSYERQIKVKYGPRTTKISIGQHDNKVKVGASLTFTCNTDANPAPHTYFWSRRYKENRKQTSQWQFKTTSTGNEQYLNSVQRGDEACYTCNATNNINGGKDSERLCIEVLYAPTKPLLSMVTEAREGQPITITCTVESSPQSILELMRTSSSNPKSTKWPYTPLDFHGSPNTLLHTFNVTSDDTGDYTCNAANDLGSEKSNPVRLVVKYRPKDVTVEPRPSLVVKENTSLTLKCSVKSHPAATRVSWTKTTVGKGSEIIRTGLEFTLKSVSPSDSGKYSCTATNEIGTGNSQQAEVKVKYAPKLTKITRAAEQLKPDGSRSVKLSCSSESFPPVTQYSWYKINAKGEDTKVSDGESYTVFSDKPGDYYCSAKNEMSVRVTKSVPVHLFDGSLKRALIIILLVFILLFIVVVVFVYRYKRKKSAPQGTTTTPSCVGFLGGWSGSRRNRMNNLATAEPFRSRDDLLPEQRPCPKARRCQTRPDSTPKPNIDSVYCTVNLPSATQGPSAARQPQDDSLHYASVHFGNKQMNKGAKVEDVYAIVSKQKQPNKNEETLEDYENVSAVHARSPNPPNYDTDSSEEEVEINYSEVSFKPKPGRQRACRDSDSSTSDEDPTQYSDVKI
ncbi:B-cell receptor CD22 [Centropristis striata]|uniref:B-cell receptor CD22 n=1 Tax=Centropristis striata TaxID=184440 RepID=UPI0027E1DD88|nr:B-cell receptor CD22 [Centropristis striata]